MTRADALPHLPPFAVLGALAFNAASMVVGSLIGVAIGKGLVSLGVLP